MENHVQETAVAVPPTHVQAAPNVGGTPKPVKGKAGRPVNTSKDNLFIPGAIFSVLQQKHRYTLDVFGHPLAPSTKILPRIVTAEQNSMQYAWANPERIWCFPPRSLIEDVLQKAWNEPAFITMLVPATTDRGWWHKFVEPYRDRGQRLTTEFCQSVSFGDPETPESTKGNSMPYTLLHFASLP